MYHFEKKNSNIFSPEGFRENVWGPRKNVSPGLAVALDGPVQNWSTTLSILLSMNGENVSLPVFA